MNKKVGLLVFASVLLLSTVHSYATERAEGTAPRETIIFADPNWIPDLEIGTAFCINVCVSDVIDLYSWEFKLYYENIPLNATSVTEGGFLKASGSTRFEVLQFDDAYNATHGIVGVNCTLLGVLNGVNGTGTFSTIFFECIDAGESNLALCDTKLSDSHGNPIPHLTELGVAWSTPWNPFRTFSVSWEGTDYKVTTHSNSTVAKLNFSRLEKQIRFYVNGISGTTGFCNLTIPKVLLRENLTHPWVVLIDGSETTYVKSENKTHASLYFDYTHSTHRVQIIGAEVIPEFQTALILPLFIIITLCAVILRRRKIKA